MKLPLALFVMLAAPAADSACHGAAIGEPEATAESSPEVAADTPKKPKPRPRPRPPASPAPKPAPDSCPACGMG